VQVDLVDQFQFEKLTADGGREHFEVLFRRPPPARPASYLDVLVVQTRTDYGSSGTAVWWPRKMCQRPVRLR
jgi:hypothetical protein